VWAGDERSTAQGRAAGGAQKADAAASSSRCGGGRAAEPVWEAQRQTARGGRR